MVPNTPFLLRLYAWFAQVAKPMMKALHMCHLSPVLRYLREQVD